jgi:hypothetical protein
LLSNGFKLVIQVPKQSAQEILVERKISLGDSSECDICIEGMGLSAKHAVFSIQKNVLMVQNHAPKGGLKIGWHKCEQGKTYILDHKDKLTLGKVSLQVFEITEDEKFLDDEIEELHDEEEIDQPEAQTDDEIDDLEEEEETQEQAPEPSEVTSIDINSLLKSGGAQHLATQSKLSSSEDEEVQTKSRFSITQTLGKLFKRSKPRLDQEPMAKRGTAPAPQLKPSKRKFKTAASRYIPGFIVRILALSLQVALSWIAMRFLFESQKFDELITSYHSQTILSITEHIHTQTGLVFETESTLTPVIFVWALSYFIIDFVTAIFFGVNIGLWLFGVRESSGFIRSRIKAIVRQPLGWITAPFIIFDIGVMAKYRTLKEYLTRSQLEKRSPLTTFFNFIFFIPIVTMLILLDPLIFLKEPIIHFGSPTLKMNDQELMPLKYFRLNSFKLDIPWTQEKDNLSLIIPNPHSEKFGIEIWSDYPGPQLSLHSGKSFDTRQWFREYLRLNPLSFYFQPKLTEFIRSSSDQELTNDLKLDIIALFQFSHLNNYTDPEILIKGLKNYGPLMSSVLKVRQSLRDNLNIDDEGTLEFWDFNNKTWIVTHHRLDQGYRFQVYPLDRVPNQSFIIETTTMSFQEIYTYASTVMIDLMPFRTQGPSPLIQNKVSTDLWGMLPFVDLINMRAIPETDFNFSESYLDSIIESLSFRFRQYLLNPNPANNVQRTFFLTRMEQVQSLLRKDLETYNPKFRYFADSFLKLYQDFLNKDLSNYPPLPTFRTQDDDSTGQ